MGTFNYFKLFISLVRNPNVKERLEESLIGDGTVDDFISNVIFKKGSTLHSKIFYKQNFTRNYLFYFLVIYLQIEARLFRV